MGANRAARDDRRTGNHQDSGGLFEVRRRGTQALYHVWRNSLRIPDGARGVDGPGLRQVAGPYSHFGSRKAGEGVAYFFAALPGSLPFSTFAISISQSSPFTFSTLRM